ncbi:MAG: hypothetical protein Q9M36_04735 [Sulfurovum sp.]|nr:hypothetical protein [Sulfurovum sp.]
MLNIGLVGLFRGLPFNYYKDRNFLYSCPLPFKNKFIYSNYCIEQLSKRLLIKYKYKLEEGYETVSFLGHGFGGIIAKKTIINLCREDLSFKGLYISLSTPHNNIDELIKKSSKTYFMGEYKGLINELNISWTRYKNRIVRIYYCDTTIP